MKKQKYNLGTLVVVNIIFGLSSEMITSISHALKVSKDVSTLFPLELLNLFFAAIVIGIYRNEKMYYTYVTAYCTISKNHYYFSEVVSSLIEGKSKIQPRVHLKCQ